MALKDDSPDFTDLSNKIKELLPEELGQDAWYLLIAAIISASPKPQHLALFYTHLTTSSAIFSTPESQPTLSLRLRDLLLKQMPLLGVPQILSAITPLAHAEGSPAPKAAFATLSTKWTDLDVQSTIARGSETIDSIYGNLLPDIYSTWGSHARDLEFMELFTIYGMYLSDHSVLTALETELVVFASITCTGLRGPSLWHMRGLGRLLGARGSDEGSEEMERVKGLLRAVKLCMVEVVVWCGKEMVKRTGLESEMGWCNVGDVKRELGGWGHDGFPSKGGRRRMRADDDV